MNEISIRVRNTIMTVEAELHGSYALHPSPWNENGTTILRTDIITVSHVGTGLLISAFDNSDDARSFVEHMTSLSDIEAEIDYWRAKGKWRKGYVRKVMALARQFGAEEYPSPYSLEEREGSRRVALAMGNVLNQGVG